MSGFGPIGVCYGMLGDGLPSEGQVIDLYKKQGIKKIRLYYPNERALQALVGSDIEVMLGVPNTDLAKLASNPSYAYSWFQKYVTKYSSSINFSYIAVGDKVSPTNYDTRDYVQYLFAAMQNMYQAVSALSLPGKQIVVSTVVEATDILQDTNVIPPSKGTFKPEVRSILSPIIDFLAGNCAPLLVDVQPYCIYKENAQRIRVDFALFVAKKPEQDGPYMYKNLFDAAIDAVYKALENSGGGAGAALDIVVAATGWPSAGGTDATDTNAKTYITNLIKRVKEGEGTPKKPAKPIETYISAMFDENKKPGTEAFEQHWGLFLPNGQPKYTIY